MNQEISEPVQIDAATRERLLHVLAAAAFLLFFQTFMVAPLIPTLADTFHASRQAVGMLVPAYTIPYAIAAFVCGVLADRFGRRGILFFSLTAFPVLGLAMAASPSLGWLVVFRIVSGVTNVAIMVVGLALAGDLFPPNDRGRAYGWVFGAVAGGCAFGSTLGGVLAPWVGWRGLFVLIAVAGVVLVLRALSTWKLLHRPEDAGGKQTIAQFAAGYLLLLRNPRGGRTYVFILLNAVFHAGVFTWVGVLLHDRYNLGEAGIGLALLGYGVPGLIFGPFIGKIVDRYGRHYLIPSGIAVAAISAFMLAPKTPLPFAMIAVTVLSLGFDMSHPLLAGIITTLDDRRRGQAMGLNTFSIFFGFGCGAALFGWLAARGMACAMVIFATGQILLAAAALRCFRSE